MVEAVYLTPEERLSQLSDTLIGAIIHKTEASKGFKASLFSQLTPQVFKNENYIIYKVLYTFKDRGIAPDEEFLRMYLMRNENVILNSKEFIDLNSFSDLDENPNVAYTIAVIKHFTRLKQKQLIDTEEFNLTLEKFKLEYKNVRLTAVYQAGNTILEEGLQVGRTQQQGYDASVSYVKRSIAEIESVLDTQAGVGFIDSSANALDDDDGVEAELVGDFGLLTELNEHLGGIYTSNFYSIIAPTKGGKSKFTTRMIHNIAVEHGNPVVVWAHEGGYKAWWAQLRAIHYDWLYNRNEPDISKHKKGISQEVILYKRYPSDAVKLLEDASRIDLFTNPSYGNIIMIDRPFNMETFIDEIETAVKSNNAKAVLIDYLQLISWTTKGLSKPQAIGQAYQKLLNYCKKRNVVAISPAQMTQDFMNEMAKSKDGASHETRAAGGESAEVIRTPDINIALYGSVEDIRAGAMKILSVPSRLSAPFPTFDIYCDLSVAMFASLTG